MHLYAGTSGYREDGGGESIGRGIIATGILLILIAEHVFVYRDAGV